LRANVLTAPYACDGPINGHSIRAWIKLQLVPAVKAGDIVIMDMCGRPPSV